MIRSAARLSSRSSRTLGLLGPLAEDGLAQLRASWRQHLLTLAGIVWGSAAVVLLLSLGAGFYEFLDLGFKKTGDRYTMVVGEYTTAATGGARPGRRVQLTREDFDRIRASVPSASRVAAEIQSAVVSLRTSRRTRTGTVSVGTPELREIKSLEVARGRFYDEEDVRLGRAVAVMGANLPEVFFGAEDPLGGTIRVEGRPFEVIGVLARKGEQLMINNALHDDMLFVPLPAGQRALGVGKRVYGMLLDPRRLEDIERMHAEARAALLRPHHISPTDGAALRVESVTEITAPFRRMAAGLTALLGFVGTMTLAMAGVGLANLMIAIVNSRRNELAMRRACGARRRDLTLQLLVETSVVVLCGGLLGVGVAVGLVLGIRALPLPDMIPRPEISVSVLATTLAVLVATGLGAGIVPARIASRVDPGSALRVT